MKSLLTRVLFALALALGALAVAGPSSARVHRSLPSTGGGWTIAASPNPAPWGNILWATSALSERDAWAVGVQATYTSNDPLAVHWDGTSWTAVPTPTPVPDCEDGNIQWGGNSLNSVDGAAPDDVWAVGGTCYGISPLLEHWNGSAWSIVAGPQPPGDAWAVLYGVAAISSGNVWAVGYQTSGEPLIEHWNGSGWSIVTPPRAAGPAGGGGDAYLSAVAARASNDVWAVGGSSSGPLIEHFDGTSWSVVPAQYPAGAVLSAVTALSPTNVWAVGFQRVSSHLTLVMHYDGTGWHVVPSPNPSEGFDADNDLRGVAAAGPNDIWAVGMYQNEQTAIHQHRTLVEHWDGATWSIVSSPSPGHSSELNAVAAPTKRPGLLSRRRVFAAGLFSNYDINIYDGTYTLPQTLVLHGG
jgi:hypothetical protein